MIRGRDVLQRGLRWNTVSGEQISLWTDKWNPDVKEFKVSSMPPTNGGPTRVAELIDWGRRSWNNLDPSPSNVIHSDKLIWKSSWKLKANPRVKTFTWRAVCNALPSLAALKHMKCISSEYMLVVWED
ncbi:conserved hypothetical protein [Ricinus communis]|uniref:Reverse transcriptase zinc-binding domain-containing protein n=1 Tax=Ricinus communis TaxID=3988 RepID=B9T5G4_RICCO|nr:conserved hypothetical protein [Ricinus communis]